MRDYLAFFQPIIDVAEGAIAGYEVLGRYRDMMGDVHSIGPFLDDADFDRDRVLAMDRAVREQALQAFAHHSFATQLSFNISPEWLCRLEPGQALPSLQMLERHQVPLSRITMELTPGDCELPALAAAVRAYQAVGMKVAMDDLGVRSGQLDRAIALGVDTYKLDMRLFRFAADRRTGLETLRALAEMAHRLGITVVCERVETAEDFELALECGARYVQGFLFYPGLPGFIAKDEPQPQVARLRSDYQHKRQATRARQREQERRVHSQAREIGRALEALGDDVDIASLPLPEPGILRFYLCDHEGEQCSANYDNVDGRWLARPAVKGSHWGWRPYFADAVADAGGQVGQDWVASDFYTDVQTGCLCRTLGLRLSGERLLLVDIEHAPSDNQWGAFTGGTSASAS